MRWLKLKHLYLAQLPLLFQGDVHENYRCRPVGWAVLQCFRNGDSCS